MNTRYLLLFLLACSLLACEKEVQLDLRNAEDEIVVDASIENNRPPIVILSKSFNYFSKISPALLAQSFVHNAVIDITEGSKTYRLKEYTYGSAPNFLYLYTVDTSSPAQLLIGKLNSSYSMSITVNGKTYKSKTTIPALVKKVDSLWWKVAPFNEDTTKRVLYARITDPPGLGNYVRYFTSVNDSAFLPGFNSVFDDDIIDGTTYDAQVSRGVDRNADFDFEESGYFKKGDTIQTKLCNIDRATYEFWRTLEYSQQSIGNPFSQPGVILGNISGGALGYFGGYATQYKRVVITN